MGSGPVPGQAAGRMSQRQMPHPAPAPGLRPGQGNSCAGLRSGLETGRGALGALLKIGGPGESSRPWEQEERSPGTGWRRSGAPGHTALSASARDGHPSPRAPWAQDWLSAASPVPHCCWEKTGVVGAAEGTQGEMGMARPRHGFDGSIPLPPSPRNKKKLPETPGCGSSSAQTHTHPTSASCLCIGKGETPPTPDRSEGCQRTRGARICPPHVTSWACQVGGLRQ